MTMYADQQHKFEMQGTLPPSHAKFSCEAGRHITISYHLRVRAILQRTDASQPEFAPLVIDGLPVWIGNWSASQAQTVFDKIMITTANQIPAMLDAPAVPVQQQAAHPANPQLPHIAARQSVAYGSTHDRSSLGMHPALYEPPVAQLSTESSHSSRQPHRNFSEPIPQTNYPSDIKHRHGSQLSQTSHAPNQRFAASYNGRPTSNLDSQPYAAPNAHVEPRQDSLYDDNDPDTSLAYALPTPTLATVQPEAMHEQQQIGQTDYSSAGAEKARLYQEAQDAVERNQAAASSEPTSISAEPAYPTAGQEKETLYKQSMSQHPIASPIVPFGQEASPVLELSAVSACERYI